MADLMPGGPAAKLLIVDDEAAQVTALSRTLREQGYETTGFVSANEALAALRAQRFDVLLTDLMMPEMNGITLLRAAQEIDAQLVGLMMTGHGAVETAVEAMKAGALDYILKPFKLSAILPVLARAVEVRQLRLRNAELEQRDGERTAELEAANKELEAFAFSVSHDLRSPLRAVCAFSDILAQDHAAHLSAEALRLLNIVVTSARRMQQLIEDLLRFSRLTSQPLSKRRVNLTTLVEEVLAELGGGQNERVEVTLGQLPDCIGDPSLLKQVLANLLSNAFKFSRHREQAVIEVGCRAQNGEPAYFVRDNGVGFDMRSAEKLFGVFQRLHPGDEFEGTGIGLSIAHRIIHRHGGRIWADAEPDHGATFYFTLPER